MRVAASFLFTDIEGSIRLWEEYPEAMNFALARHDRLIRQAVEANGGRVFKTVGDACYAVFAAAPDGLRAALAAQRALQAEEWGETPIRVRMALHTGVAEERDGDYFGSPVNRVARLLAAGHGGQTLLSMAMQEGVGSQLPAEASLRDMGERRLKDLVRPERIFQLLAPGLPADFPPLKTLDTFRTNLPVQLTSFIGREKEMAEVKQLLAANRLVTLTGAGGTGKTRLSLEVAADLLDSFPDGLWFVELAPLADPALLLPVVAAALGVREETGWSLLATLVDFLRPKTALLIMDNCEHLIESSARLVETLLRECPKLRLLASSREAMGLAGETTYYVPSLAIPDPRPGKAGAVESLADYEAVRLFVERARTALPTFALTDDNASAVALICRQLDGIPLAIELAAARVKLLRADQIAARLDGLFRLLTGGSRTSLPRHQTLRALIDWSYDLLTEPERALLRRLAVFAGGWTLKAAEAVCDFRLPVLDFGLESKIQNPKSKIESSPDLLELISQLVNKSLVVGEREPGTETRYHLLETIRHYGWEKLVAAGEEEQIRDAHLHYYLNLSKAARPQLIGPMQAAWLARLELELDNLRAALEWSLERHVEAGLRLASALERFWEAHGYLRDGYQWLEQLLARPAPATAGVSPAVQVRAIASQSYLALWLADLHRAQALAEESLRLYRHLGDRSGEALALSILGYVLCALDDYVQGQPLVLQSLAIYRELGDKFGIAETLNQLGSQVDNQDYPRTRAYLEESLVLYRQLGHLAGIGSVLISLGKQTLWQGDYALARPWLEEGLATQAILGEQNTVLGLYMLGTLAVRQGDFQAAETYLSASYSLSKATGLHVYGYWAFVWQGYLAVRRGDLARARAVFAESQQLFAQAGSKIGVIFALEGCATAAVLAGDTERAARLLAWAEAARLAIGDNRPPVEQADVESDLAIIRLLLDEQTLAAARDSGRLMSMEQAMAYALG